MSTTKLRTQLSIISGLAFFAFFWLIENNLLFGNAYRLPIFYTLTFMAAAFTSAVALSGPLKLSRAWVWAIGIGLSSTLLMMFVRSRFVWDHGLPTLSKLFPQDPSLLWLAFGVMFSWPFIIVYDKKSDIWDYDLLHEAAWGLMIRGLIALFFGGVLLLLTFLISATFEIVKITFLSDLLEEVEFSMGIYGIGFGFAAAVAWNSEKLIAQLRFIAISLLRFLIPLQTLVLFIFILQFVRLGMSTELIAGLSPTGIIIAVSYVSITLISSALENSSENALSKILAQLNRIHVFIAMLLVPFLIYGIFTRIFDYGLTPMRIFAVILALYAGAYLLGYAFAMIRGLSNWQDIAQRINIILAISTIGVAVIINSPILNPYKLSAASQISRIDAGLTQFKPGDLNDFRNWGESGVMLMNAMHAQAVADDDVTWVADIIKAKSGKWVRTITSEQSDPEVEKAKKAQIEEISKAITVIPPSKRGEIETYLEPLSAGFRATLQASCQRQTVAGNPQCIAYFDDELTMGSQMDLLLIYCENALSLKNYGKASGCILEIEGLPKRSANSFDIEFRLFPKANPKIFDEILEFGVRKREERYFVFELDR